MRNRCWETIIISLAVLIWLSACSNSATTNHVEEVTPPIGISDTEPVDPTPDGSTVPGTSDVDDSGSDEPSEYLTPPADEETLTAILDRDGTDGFTGDFVLIYNPVLWDGGSLRTGTLDGLIDTTGEQAPVDDDTYYETTPGLYSDPDPYVTDEVRQADICYEFDGDDPWQVGFQKIFYVAGYRSDGMLFIVSAVGERCRIWSPVNPAYGPLESVDPTWPEQLAEELDRTLPVLEQFYGPIPDIRGDGKMNIVCFDFNSPTTSGFCPITDVYGELHDSILVPGNGLSTAYVNTAPVLQGRADLSALYSVSIHETQHCIFYAMDYPDGTLFFSRYKQLFGEFLAVAAQELVYPGHVLHSRLPYWYSETSTWAGLAVDDAPFYLRGSSKRQSGDSLFYWYDTREDYAFVCLLAYFVENRGGPEVFARIMSRWENTNNVADTVGLIWEELGYEDYVSFVEDLLLSIMLHEESGPYQLHTLVGYDPADWEGDEYPFARLVPIAAASSTSIRIGGYTVIRPAKGVYYPPDNASDGLQYVGVTLKSDGT